MTKRKGISNIKLLLVLFVFFINEEIGISTSSNVTYFYSSELMATRGSTSLWPQQQFHNRQAVNEENRLSLAFSIPGRSTNSKKKKKKQDSKGGKSKKKSERSNNPEITET